MFQQAKPGNFWKENLLPRSDRASWAVLNHQRDTDRYGLRSMVFPVRREEVCRSDRIRNTHSFGNQLEMLELVLLLICLEHRIEDVEADKSVKENFL